MYLHLGQYTVVHTGDIVGIFDLDNSSVSRTTKEYLAQAQKRGFELARPKIYTTCELFEHEKGKVLLI